MKRRMVLVSIDPAGSVSLKVKEGPPPDEDVGLPLEILAEAAGTSSHLELTAHMLTALRTNGLTFLKQTHPPWCSVDLELLRQQIAGIDDIKWLTGVVPGRFGEECSASRIHLHTTLYPRRLYTLNETESWALNSSAIVRDGLLRGATGPAADTARLTGGRIFVGHGRSSAWRELKDFLQDRLGLAWDEFSRDATAGLSTKERLETILSDAVFAFLIMTAEDERADGAKTARANVIHEVGLFQGRLGFERAIVLLEEGCEEFSNIAGLSQIRFPRNNIKAAFEEIRRVLEREHVVS